ncbi:MAG: deoxyribonuclease V [Planctomycetes bacterium]|nr:deoxyribonuclease V [Planctomycetota bacterium]
MKVPASPHRWRVTPRQAVAVQRRLADRVVAQGSLPELGLVAGGDLAFLPGGKECVAGVVVWDVPRGSVFEQQVVRCPVRFPYVPGLLSFREAPALLAALRKLRATPDLFLFDGQGYAHPRRFGLACHLGVLLDRPAVGCAKSLLLGTHATLSPRRGAAAPLMDGEECVGMAVRTREAVKPVFVSVGHRVSLEAAVAATLACCTRYRIPEPTRLADQLVTRERGK